jgi:hypothetical protein
VGVVTLLGHHPGRSARTGELDLGYPSTELAHNLKIAVDFNGP